MDARLLRSFTSTGVTTTFRPTNHVLFRPDILDYENVRNMLTAIERLDYTYSKVKNKLGVEPVLSMKGGLFE